MISPVNYVFDERTQSVAFRSADGTKLHELRHVDHAVFEIDEIDPVARAGWSVIDLGRSRGGDPPRRGQAARGLGLDVWAPGRRRALDPDRRLDGVRTQDHRRVGS